jgi:hypothetical protein
MAQEAGERRLAPACTLVTGAGSGGSRGGAWWEEWRMERGAGPHIATERRGERETDDGLRCAGNNGRRGVKREKRDGRV